VTGSGAPRRAESGASGRARGQIKRVAGYGVVAVILGFMARTLYVNWQSLRGYEWRFNYPLLALAIVAALGTLSLYAWQWGLVVRRLGVSVSHPEAFRIYFLSNLGRYVPGKVWQFVGWFYLAEQAGIGRVQVLTAIAVNLSLQALTGLGLGVAALSLVGGSSGEVRARYWPLLLLIPLGAIALQPAVMETGLNWGLRRLGREPVVLGLRRRDMALFAFVHVCGWVAYGVSFSLFVGSLRPVSVSDLPLLGATYAAAWVIGFLSFLTPGGIGIREGVLAYLLGFWLPAPVAIVVGLLSRIWITAGELIGAGIAWRIRPPRVPLARSEAE
jgi:glycosyltransferase 2 family protein